MNWLDFFASIIQSLTSLAWPAAIVICVLLFRDRLAALLPLIRVKHKDWEASFRLDKAEREAERLPEPEDVPPEPTPEEIEGFEEIVRVSPRAAILELRANLEEALRNLARDAGLTNWERSSLVAILRQLRSEDKIDSHTSALLDDLRAFGNTAAHSTNIELTIEDARRYRELADKALSGIELSRMLL